jgi:HSP20 family molecular chaperone IbpA
MMVRNMFDELTDTAFSGHSASGMMRTDIRESDSCYELAIDLPGVKKENLSAELKDNYLMISATVGQTDDQDNQAEQNGKPNWRYLRRERFVGTVRRSFYVGDKVQQENIKAKYQDGTLYLRIPKLIPQPELEQKNLIAIEG